MADILPKEPRSHHIKTPDPFSRPSRPSQNTHTEPGKVRDGIADPSSMPAFLLARCTFLHGGHGYVSMAIRSIVNTRILA